MISEFRAGRVVGESFKLVFRHFLTIGGISFICCLPLIAVFASEPTTQDDPEEAFQRSALSRSAARDPNQLLASLAMYLTYPLAAGSIAFAVYRSLRGQRVSFLESFGAGLKRILPLFGILVCSFLFIGMGFLPAFFFLSYGLGSIPWVFLVIGTLLLLIPGFMLVMMVYVANPVCIVEKKGVFASMRRSRELSYGHRWQLFVAMIGVGLLAYIFTWVVGFATAQVFIGLRTDPRSSMILPIGVTVLMMFFLSWSTTAPAVAYYHLRSVKDSVEVDDVANVFD